MDPLFSKPTQASTPSELPSNDTVFNFSTGSASSPQAPAEISTSETLAGKPAKTSLDEVSVYKPATPAVAQPKPEQFSSAEPATILNKAVTDEIFDFNSVKTSTPTEQVPKSSFETSGQAPSIPAQKTTPVIVSPPKPPVASPPVSRIATGPVFDFANPVRSSSISSPSITNNKGASSLADKTPEPVPTSNGTSPAASDGVNAMAADAKPLGAFAWQATEAMAKASAPAPIYDLRRLRTLKGDMDDTIKAGNVSLAHIAIQNANKARATEKVVVRSNIWKGIFIGLASLLVFGGIGVAGYFWYQGNNAVPVLPGNTPVAPIGFITANNRAQINLTGLATEEARSAVSKSVVETVQRIGFIEEKQFTVDFTDENGDKRLYLMPAGQFLELVSYNVPDRFLRFLRPEIMFGVFTYRTTGGFVIVRTDSYQNGFAEMLNWEKRLSEDLYTLISVEPLPESLKGRAWSDAVSNNTDLRVLKDEMGNIKMLYSFMGTTDTIIIASHEEVFAEVLNRFKTPEPVER